jgi:hypothetical protein
MYKPIQLADSLPSLGTSISQSPLRRSFVAVALAFTLALTARAVDPPPDGGYFGHNTAEGNDALFSRTTGTDNTAVGFDALFSLTTGSGNTAMGFQTLVSNTVGSGNTAIGISALSANTTGSTNTAVGDSALSANTTGQSNTATGGSALFQNTTGTMNTATGLNALGFNTAGSFNTATGNDALISNTTGGSNTATGTDALFENTTGSFNTATGLAALSRSTAGSFNTATGADALAANTNGIENTATGADALFNNSTGKDNAASGFQALTKNTSGSFNAATGQGALESNTSGHNNTADGQNALHNNTTGSFNSALGENAGFNLTTGSNNIDIGNFGVAGESGTIRIGTVGTQTATFIAGISGATVPGGVAVVIDANGHLGVRHSSARFKEAIKPMDKASEAILALKPVTFRYKHELDPEGIAQFGLVAEQVEKVNPDLVARDADGKAYTVRYEAVNAMLLNEFLKEHRKVGKLQVNADLHERKIEQQAASIAQLKADVAKQQAMNTDQRKEIQTLAAALKEQAAQLQKVSDQLEVSKSTGQLVAENR